MKNKRINPFFIVITLGLVLTCLFGVRPIGKDLYTYYKGIPQYHIVENINNLFKTVDKTLNNNFVFREQCVNVYGWLQRIKGSKIVKDADPSRTVIKGNDGKLYFLRNATGDHDNSFAAIDRNVSQLAKFDQFCAENSVDLLFAIAPSKYSSEIDLPDGIEIQDNKLYSDYMTEALRTSSVEILNLRDELLTHCNSHSDAFFITDHHWNIPTAFWGYQRICESLNERFSTGIDKTYYEEAQFSSTTYPDVLLGSMGVRVGKYYAGMDDLDLIAPEFDTDFSLDFKSKTLGTDELRTGTFLEALITDDISYQMYLTSDNSMVHVDNRSIANGHKALFIKDSFGIPVSAWLACWADELWVMDLRYPQTESVQEFICNNGIDTVIIMYNEEMLSTELVFNFDEVSLGK